MPKIIRTGLTVLLAALALAPMAATATSATATASAAAVTKTSSKATGYWTTRWVCNGYYCHRIRVWVGA